MNEGSSDNIWWWLDTRTNDGAWHMAVDQFLTEQIEASRRPVMRVYQWRPWCISLGYHQSIRHIDLDQCRNDGIDVVRRQTGGRAVFHAEELTYSVILPRGHALTASVASTYEQISLGLTSGLKKIGVPAEFQKRKIDLRTHYTRKISESCFSAASLHEIVVEGRKLVGSAQRRLPGGVLQHGSILTGPAHLKLFRYFKDLSEQEKASMASEMKEKTTTITSVLKTPPARHQISQALKTGMSETFQVEFQERYLTSGEEEAIADRTREFTVLKNEREA